MYLRIKTIFFRYVIAQILLILLLSIQIDILTRSKIYREDMTFVVSVHWLEQNRYLIRQMLTYWESSKSVRHCHVLWVVNWSFHDYNISEVWKLRLPRETHSQRSSRVGGYTKWWVHSSEFSVSHWYAASVWTVCC